MGSKSKKKGDALEKAVRLIQKAILTADPKLAGAKFSIEAKKIIKVDGVTHEVDVFVKTLPESAYESVSVFECKNWAKPVGKNEVLILAGKVQAIGASKGFLVAKKFTKDALAQIKQDRRLQTVICDDDFLSPLNLQIFHISHQPEKIQVHIKERGVPTLEHPNQLDWKDVKCRLDGKSVDFCSYISTFVKEICDADKKEKGTKYEHNASHWDRSALLVEFSPNEFQIDERDVERMTIDVSFWINVHTPRIISQFRLQGQGAVYSFESAPDGDSGRKVEINIVVRG